MGGNIAEIGFRADTSQLVTAKADIEALAPAAVKAETANNKLEKVISELNGTVTKLNTSSSGLTNTTKTLTVGNDNLAGSIDKVNNVTKKASGETEGLNKNLNASASAGKSASNSVGLFAAGLTLLAVFGIAAIASIPSFLLASSDAFVKLGETAKRTGLDLERLQQLQFVGVSAGLSRTQTGTGLEKLAEKLNEINNGENTLSKFLDDNNIKYKDRNGALISTNDLLLKASGLVQNAATEFDKIKIAEAFGLTKDWVPFLEQGADQIDKIAGNADKVGNSIDSGMVKRAEEFRREWAVAIDKWTMMFQSAAGPILAFIDGLIEKASGLLGRLNNYAVKTLVEQDLNNNGSNFNKDTANFIKNKSGIPLEDLAPEVRKRIDDLDEFDREKNRFAQRSKQSQPLVVTVGARKTNVTSLFDQGASGRGGGNTGKTDAENFDDIVNRAERRIAKFQAEKDAIGLTAEATAKLKYETDLLNQAKQRDIDLTPEQISKIKELAGQMSSLEIQTKNTKDALDFGKNLTKGFIDDFITGIKNGENAFQSLGKAALGVLNKIGDKLVSLAVDSLFTTGGGGGGGLGGFLSGIFKLFGSAKGNAFDGVHRFANGGSFTNSIIRQPTLFKFANGGALGEMGEAGPEAVMPLQRGPDGSLGVQMYGGGGAASSPVNNNVEVTNVYRIEGAISEERIVMRIRSSAEATVDEVKKSLIPWLNRYGADGAL